MKSPGSLKDLIGCVQAALLDSSTPVFVAGAGCGVLCAAAVLLALPVGLW